jgi:hypothetical protein
VGVDPSSKGSQTVEATDLLLRKRRLNTDGHVVVWQIGCVGDLGFNFAGYDNRNLNILVDYLESYYDKDHEVVHYQGSQYPMCPSTVERMPLGALRKANVTGISTLYIPPQDEIETDIEMARSLGLVVKRPKPVAETAENQPKPAITAKPDEKKSLKPAASGSRYFPSPEHSGLATFISYVSENPLILAEFNRNPELTAAIHANLTIPERDALLSRHSGRIRMAIKQSHWSDERVKAIDATQKLYAGQPGAENANTPAGKAEALDVA